MQNRLDDLPVGLSDMNKLQILKIAGNPLRYPLRRVLEASEAEIAPNMTDNEKEVAVTAELKRFLRTRQQATTPEPESSGDTRFVHSLTNLYLVKHMKLIDFQTAATFHLIRQNPYR
jgi:hypothetical protein